MNRQYIGARYVPKFDGEWNSQKTYEALTIVTYGNGSYTSKTTVPAGTLPTNTDFWALTGNVNGQIVDINERLTALESEITETHKLRIIFVGDSYAVTTSDSGTAYPYLVGGNLGLELNRDYYVTAIGGASWKGLNGRKSYETLLREIENSVTDKDTIDLIIVCGGVNDAVGTISDIYTGAESFASYAKETYHNAKIVTGMIGWNTDKPTMTNIKNISYAGYNNLGAYGIGVIDNANMLMHDYRCFQADGTHPTSVGNAQIAYGISSYIISGNCCMNGRSEVETNVTLNSSMFSSGSLKFKENRTNGVISVSWSNADLAFASGATLGYDTLFTIGTKESVYWKTSSVPEESYCTAQAKLVWNDGSYHSEPVMLRFVNDDGVLKAYPCMSNQFNNIASPVYLSIYAGSATFIPTVC